MSLVAVVEPRNILSVGIYGIRQLPVLIRLAFTALEFRAHTVPDYYRSIPVLAMLGPTIML